MSLAPSITLHYHRQTSLILAYLDADHRRQNFYGFSKAEAMSSDTLNAYGDSQDFVRMIILQGSVHVVVLEFVLIKSTFFLLRIGSQLSIEEK